LVVFIKPEASRRNATLASSFMNETSTNKSLFRDWFDIHDLAQRRDLIWFDLDRYSDEVEAVGSANQCTNF
jgi:hypothetical protein